MPPPSPSPAFCGGTAVAGAAPYPDVGEPNPTTYTFTAEMTGDVEAFFVGSGRAALNEEIGMSVNGVSTGACKLSVARGRPAKRAKPASAFREEIARGGCANASSRRARRLASRGPCRLRSRR